MKTSDVDLLLCVEGRAMDRDHWVNRWARNLRTGRLVDVTSAPGAAAAGGVGPLHAAISDAARPVVLVGYHLGVASIVEAAEQLAAQSVRGAFLVAPADLALGSCEQHDAGTLSSAPLPFPVAVGGIAIGPTLQFRKGQRYGAGLGLSPG